MPGTKRMAKDDNVATPKAGTVISKDMVKVRLTLDKRTARKLGRVSRWERESEATSLELTGRS